MSVSKERREELRLELSEGAPGMAEVSLFPDELRALLDMANERDAKDEEIASLIDAQADTREALEQVERERDRYRALLEVIVDRHGETACTDDCECEVVESGCLGDALHNEVLKARAALEGNTNDWRYGRTGAGEAAGD